MITRFKWKEGSRMNQIIFAILVNIPVFSYGTAVGWMSPMTLLLQSKNSPRDKPMTDAEISWMASACYLTCVPSNFLFAYMCDRWGRKMSALVSSFYLFACWATKLLSTSIWAFILARAMVGVSMAGCYLVSLIYIKEISDDCIRGALATMGILSQTIGNLLLYILGDILSYRPLLWVCLSIPAFHMIIFMLMPESPAFLIKKGKHKEAMAVVAWLTSRQETDPIVEQNLNVLKREQEQDEQYNKFLLKSVLSHKILRKAFIISLVLTLAREACGAIPVTNFAGDIFRLASEGGSKMVLRPNQQAIVLGSVQVLGCILASVTIEKVGRKPLLTITALLSGLSMLILATWFLARSFGFQSLVWVPVTTLCLCIFCDASGLQPVCFVILGELFSYEFRSTIMAVTLAMGALADFLQMLFFKQIAASVGVHVTFYFFAAVCLFSTIYIVLEVPETKKKSVEEIYQLLEPKKPEVRRRVSIKDGHKEMKD